MSSASPLLAELIDALRCLPGVGAKSAQRMAFHLLERERERGLKLAGALEQAMQRIGNCSRCRNFSEDPVCPLCASTSRDRQVLCVVESPTDLAAVEQATGYRGQYFVLLGRLSPLDGVGTRQIGAAELLARAAEAGVGEVILATSFTAEGEATAHVLAEALKARGITSTRLARGVPVGSELEYVDLGTIAHALSDRR